MNQTHERDYQSSSTAMSSSFSTSAFTSLVRINTTADRDVTYSCGSCGYALNLSSCNRNTSVIGSEYGKAMKRGVISFFCIDESRFTHVTKFRCLPYFRSKNSWGLFRRHTKLLCRECGSYIGIGYSYSHDNTYPSSVKPETEIWDGLSACRSYDIKICSLRPSSSEEEPDLLVEKVDTLNPKRVTQPGPTSYT